MKIKCKECGKKKKSTEFGLIKMDISKQIRGLILTHRFNNICDDCAKLTKKKGQTDEL